MISASEEEQIWTRAVAFLEQGRPGDLEHTRSVVANGKILLAREGGNPRVVIPTLILHDVGWGRVDFSDFIAAPAEAKRDVESVHLHMRYGAEIASDILSDLGWDEEPIRKITSIIAVHDIPEKVLALDDLDATLVFEADWLDKYVPEKQNRYFGVAPDREELKEIKEYLKANRLRWFRTRTSRELLNRIISRRR
jgi:HD superfamily phosphodiesterase